MIYMLNKIADRKRNVVMNFVFPGDDAAHLPGLPVRALWSHGKRSANMEMIVENDA
ncbi:hypothetical protein CWC43_25370 [Klebsiella aerogenes]|nr:hypothetical protein CWC42_25200 [Klebsiella aerogenes]RXX24596.1 hypothetical protein CWC43_25370 [Klebsiella aerogenes]